MATYVNHLNFLSTYFTFHPSTVPVSEEKLQPILVSTTPNIRDFFDMSHIFSRKLLVIGKFQSTFAPKIEN